MIRYFIIFGASGDLTSRYLLPTLAQLRRAEMLGADMQILGIAPEDWDTAFFQNYICAKLKLHVPDVVDVWTNDLSSRLEYRKADVTKPEQVQAALASVHEAAVLYLALPPAVLLAALRSILAARVPEGSRIVLEKPCGSDLQSARAVNELGHQGFSEKSVFRIDHCIG
jgi:glucose-6-phosphate 1-dehydrogenase